MRSGGGECPAVLGADKAGAVLAVLAMLGARPSGSRLRVAARGCARWELASLAPSLVRSCARRGRRCARPSGSRAKETMMLRIYPVLLELITELQPALGLLNRRDPDLARQCRRALSSGALNIAEGSYNRGRNRAARYHTAAGSVREALACFEVAAALGYMPMPEPKVFARFNLVIGTLVNLCGGH